MVIESAALIISNIRHTIQPPEIKKKIGTFFSSKYAGKGHTATTALVTWTIKK